MRGPHYPDRGFQWGCAKLGCRRAVGGIQVFLVDGLNDRIMTPAMAD